MWTIIQNFNPVVIVLLGMFLTFMVIVWMIGVHEAEQWANSISEPMSPFDIEAHGWDAYEDAVAQKAMCEANGEEVPRHVQQAIDHYRGFRDDG